MELFGFGGTATVRGMMDSTHNVIYDAVLDETFDVGQGPETYTDDSPWFRWDPVVETVLYAP